MFQGIRKYYDSGFAGMKASDFTIVDPSQTVATPVAQEPTVIETPATPTEVTEVKPAEKQEEAAPITPKAPVEEPKPVVKIENEAPVIEAPVVAPPKTFDEIAKEYGYDDFGINALKYYKETGDLSAYARVHSIDYKTMAPEQVLRQKLREDYPDLNEDALEVIYQEDVADKYKLDPDRFSEAEVAAGKARLKRDAEPVRKEFLEYQSKFRAPERNTEAQEQAAAAEQQAEYQRQLDQITNDPASKSLLTGKRLSFDIGDDGEQFTFEPANPADVLGALTDNENWVRETSVLDKNGKLILDAKGRPTADVKKLLKAAAFLKHEKQIMKGMFDKGFAEGQKKQFVALTDPETTAGSPPQTEESIPELFQKRGVKRNWV